MEIKVRHLVVALVFDPTLERVLLVRKITKGAMRWMNGRLNGPGGKVEQTDASSLAAATRELQEETGVFLSMLRPLARLQLLADFDTNRDIVEVHFFYGVTHQQPRQLEAEPVFWLSVEEALSDPALIDNLRELIPQARAALRKSPDFEVSKRLFEDEKIRAEHGVY